MIRNWDVARVAALTVWLADPDTEPLGDTPAGDPTPLRGSTRASVLVTPSSRSGISWLWGTGKLWPRDSHGRKV